jgi:hypothetical protein
MARRLIEAGFQVFSDEGGEEFGAVREVRPAGRPEIVVYVENFGEAVIPLGAVKSVHDQKVVLDAKRLDRRLRLAIGHAHDSERPGF